MHGGPLWQNCNKLLNGWYAIEIWGTFHFMNVKLFRTYSFFSANLLLLSAVSPSRSNVSCFEEAAHSMPSSELAVFEQCEALGSGEFMFTLEHFVERCWKPSGLTKTKSVFVNFVLEIWDHLHRAEAGQHLNQTPFIKSCSFVCEDMLFSFCPVFWEMTWRDRKCPPTVHKVQYQPSWVNNVKNTYSPKIL